MEGMVVPAYKSEDDHDLMTHFRSLTGTPTFLFFLIQHNPYNEFVTLCTNEVCIEE